VPLNLLLFALLFFARVQIKAFYALL